jgi:hypothetical protein
MEADAVVTADFINYSVMAVQNGGKVINNGALALEASVIGDTTDRAPWVVSSAFSQVNFQNKGSVFPEKRCYEYRGRRMLAVIEGTFTNDATVIADGFQIDIASTFIK